MSGTMSAPRSSRQHRSTVSATPRPSRASAAAPTPTTSRRGQQQQQHQATELPEYQPPTHALNEAGRDALKALITSRRVARFGNHMKTAIECLSENAYALNDTLFEKGVVAEKDRKRHDRDAPDNAEDEERVRKLEQDVQTMREKVDAMTHRMDLDLRKMIDTREYFNSIRPVLEEIGNEADVFARANAGSQPPSTQRTRSQRRARRVTDNDDLDSDEEDEEYHDFTPTDPTNAQTQSTQRPPATITLFKEKLQSRKDRYQTQSHRVRYAQDNDYRNFRKTLHDARFGEDAPPLPHESLWFDDDGVANLARPGETDFGAAQGEDSDDDLQIAKAKISTKCPLTLCEFVDPVTSRKCPHSFEREAIMGMIDSPGNLIRSGGSNRRGANDGKRAVNCPVPGCGEVLTKDDLHTDSRLVHKIKRIQRAAEEQDDDDGENENGAKNRPQSINSDASDDEEVDVDDVERRQEREETAKRVKLERFSQRQR